MDWEAGEKRADDSPDFRRPAPLMDTRNTREVTDTSLAFSKERSSFLEDRIVDFKKTKTN